MALSQTTIDVLARVAVLKVDQFPADEQIRIYQALGDALPNRDARESAQVLAQLLSKYAAMQLEFKNLNGGTQ